MATIFQGLLKDGRNSIAVQMSRAAAAVIKSPKFESRSVFLGNKNPTSQQEKTKRLRNRNGGDPRGYIDDHQDGGTCGACTPNCLPEHRSDELQPCSKCCNGQESMGQFEGCVTALQDSGYIQEFGLIRPLNGVK